MARMKYSQEQLDFLEQGYKKMEVAELVKAFNDEFGMSCGFKQIRSTLSRYGFLAGRMPKRGGNMWAEAYTEAECVFLRDHSHLRNEEIANLFNARFERKRSYHSIQNKLSNMGMTKVSPKKLELGDVCSYHEQGYLLVKTEKVKCGRTYKHYRYKHIVIWEEANGPVPKGNVIRFLDGNNQNCSLENLAMFTKSENSHLNMLRYNDAPEELKDTIMLTARLKARISERQREL